MTTTVPETKVCNTCQETKPIKAFATNGDRILGKCRICAGKRTANKKKPPQTMPREIVLIQTTDDEYMLCEVIMRKGGKGTMDVATAFYEARGKTILQAKLIPQD
jgi:hypothetical protein